MPENLTPEIATPENSSSTLRRKMAGGAQARAPMKHARAVVDRLERGLADDLSFWLKTVVSARVTATRTGDLADARADGRALYAVTTLSDGAFAALLVFPSALVSRLVEHQTGAGESLTPPPAERAFTAIDMALMSPFADLLVRAFEDGLSADPSLAGAGIMRRSRYSENFDSVLTMEGDPRVWDVTLDIALSPGGEASQARLLISLAALDHYRVSPTPASAADPGAVEAEGAWGAAMLDAVRRAEIRMVGVLHQRALNLEELDHLEIGAIIPLPISDRLDVELRLDAPDGVANQQAIGFGQLGAADGWRAVRLTSEFDPALIGEIEPYAVRED